MKNFHFLAAISLLMIAASCSSTERPNSTPSKQIARICVSHDGLSPGESWVLGDSGLVASLWVTKKKSATVCIFDAQKNVVDSVDTYFGDEDFIASQTCIYNGRVASEIFGVGRRGRINDVDLHSAWIFRSKENRLDLLDPSKVRCLYKEMDE